MPELTERGSQVWKGMRRGVGWAFGAGIVLTAAGVLRDGGRETLKTLMKQGMRGREAAAELSEQLQDLYAEAQSEHAPEAPEKA